MNPDPAGFPRICRVIISSASDKVKEFLRFREHSAFFDLFFLDKCIGEAYNNMDSQFLLKIIYSDPDHNPKNKNGEHHGKRKKSRTDH